LKNVASEFGDTYGFAAAGRRIDIQVKEE